MQKAAAAREVIGDKDDSAPVDAPEVAHGEAGRDRVPLREDAELKAGLGLEGGELRGQPRLVAGGEPALEVDDRRRRRRQQVGARDALRAREDARGERGGHREEGEGAQEGAAGERGWRAEGAEWVACATVGAGVEGRRRTCWGRERRLEGGKRGHDAAGGGKDAGHKERAAGQVGG